MGMLLIEGQFRILNTAPDGDSIRFYPNNTADWQMVPGRHLVQPNSKGGAQLRFDAIDALETHYPVGGSLGTVHQPLPFAHEAAQALLDWLGFTGVTRDTTEKVTAATPDQVPGYVLTRTADKYGRCVSFVFKGAAPAPSGKTVYFDVAQLRKSANYHLIKLGLVYPTYYTKLYPDIRGELTRAVQAARQGTGLWPKDMTNRGFTLKSIESITETKIILPKLFRRLMAYLDLNDGDISLDGFKDFMARQDDRMFILSTGHATGFDYVVKVVGQRLSLTRPPEDLVFVEG